MQLNEEEIRSQLVRPVDLQLFDSINSTNSYLLAEKVSERAVVCLAEQQTDGRGRLGREWHSPHGENIYLSCAYPLQKNADELTGLSLVMSLAVCHALEQFGIDVGLGVKWPNDILVNNKKLAGILVELRREGQNCKQCVVGIGLNVNMTAEQEDISQPWTSMQLITGVYQNRNMVSATIINSLLVYLEKLVANNFSPYIEEWQSRDVLLRRTVTLQSPKQEFTGRVMGVNERGQIVLLLENGETHVFSAGDVSIKK